MNPEPIKVTSYFDPRDEWPYVALSWGPMDAHLTTAEAQEFAAKIMLCSVAAEQDAFLVDFLQQASSLPAEQVARLLAELRKYRDKLNKEIR